MHGSRPLVSRFNSSFFLLALVAMLVMSPVAFGQATTGALAGSVSAAEDGAFLPGVTIEAIHVPTGTVYTSVTGGNGRFMIPNVRVGGPYKVTATLEGFQPSETGGVNVNLGATAEVPVFKIRMGAFEESIVVTADADPLINPNKSGSTSAISTEQIETLPTVNRTLQDFARTNPYVNVDAQDISATRMYVAGKNNRYNSIQIDGAVNNDLFGLADTGTPGGQANAQAISLEAIQEIQVAVSPYDVRQGGFTGGGVNAITRSGGNDLQGSVFYSKRDPEWVGDGPNNNPISAFDSEQYGGRVGGRIIRDKLFFFVNGEYNDRNEDDDYTAQNYRRPEDVQIVSDFLREEFGYDAGGLGSIARASESKNFFGRVDWNVNSSNQFTIRHNYVNASNDVISDRNSNRFRFPKSTYFFEDETNSTVMQLNSVFSSNAFNEARVSYTTIKDRRASAEPFPGIEIGGTGPRNADIIAGSEQFSTANSLDQDILEITDDFTLLRGSHNITIGTHNEIFDFNNVFMPSAFGHYYFPTLQDFLDLNPSKYFYTYAEGGINPSKFKVNQLGLYASDQWAVRPNLTLTFGLRADAALYPDSPNYNPIVDQAIGYDTSATPDEDPTFSPRLGANWQIDEKQQLRGGIGIFAGRTPYVWISNAYGGTGIGQISISCETSQNCTPTFVSDPFNQPTNFPSGGGAFDTSLTDPDFQSPRLWRATVGYDRLLPWDIRATVEVLYSKTIEDVYYQNVNYIETGAVSPLDGRVMYKRSSTLLANAYLLTNTSKGDQLMESVVLSKTFSHFTMGATYAHQEANSAFDGTSSTASSNWRFHHTKGNIYEPELSRSAFETEHRYNISGTFNFATGFITHAIGVYYNAQSGRPYSLMIGTDVNGDGQSSNDLLYIPGSATEVIVQNSAGQVVDYSLLGNYLAAADLDSLAGRAMDRYEATEPWVRQMDLHYELGLPSYQGVFTMITADVTNVLAMIDEEYGEVRYVPNQNFSPVTYRGVDAATGKPIYRERFSGALTPGSQFSTATDRSRWQARLGVRVTF
ncbi:MAG: TonB-dependent receptor [Thermoanaerobaculia bacterium]